MQLKSHSSFKMGGKATHFVEIKTEGELQKAVHESKRLGIPFHILGKGTVFHHEKVNKFVIINAISGIDVLSTKNGLTVLRVCAGEHWDDAVRFAVDNGFSGIEALSAIPGSAGAAPVQNIGAYGQEIKDTLEGLRAYNIENDSFVVLSNSDCQFAYRDSIFKHFPNKYIITAIYLKLSKKDPKLPGYPGVKEYFEKHKLNTEKPSLIDIRNAIIEIRKTKLPDPSIVPNCGSFFKNAIVCKEHFEAIQKKYPKMPHFAAGVSDGKELVKIPTGWLLEQAGFKDMHFGNFKTHDKNALVMTHIGDGTLDELKSVIQTIQTKIKEMFGIDIELEANIVE
jgi:UDP-N-acetylmuramate dehydrogenase